jgi:cob(I)alamin adenosyltransferase
VLTGNGKGKSSSAFGMVARTLGYGRAAVFQFIKGAEMWASAPSSRASPA